MIFPLYQHDVFGYATGIALAVGIGFGFGLALERAGFGKAMNLVAQFYGDDMRVFKVMFTAIVTNLVGLGVLAGLGVVELGALKIPGTFLAPQLVGGLLLGVGFVVSGYCPGTAFVGAASGRVDAVFSLVGVVAGTLLFGFAWPWVEGFYGATDYGTITFVDVTGIPWPVLAGAVAVIAGVGFLGAEVAERWLATRRGTTAPEADSPARNTVFLGVGVAAVAGLATLALPEPVEAQPIASVDHIDGTALASQLVENPLAIWLVDVRAPGVCEASRIPGAVCAPADDVPAFLASLPPTRRVVVYGGAEPIDPGALFSPITVLDGGYPAFAAAALTAPVASINARPAAADDFELHRALYAKFAGVQVAAAPARPAVVTVKKAGKKGGGC